MPGEQVAIALDVAASELGRNGFYKLGLEGRELDSEGMIVLLLGWLERYPIVSVEDPLAEDDLDGFAAFTQAVGERVQVVADDLTVTDAARVAAVAARGAANTLLVKPNQRGTLTETRAAFDAAARRGLADDRLGALGRDRGCHDRASRGRLGCPAAQGRLVRAFRAHGEMERGAAHRGGAGRRGAARAAVRALTGRAARDRWAGDHKRQA